METTSTSLRHPVLGCADEIEAALKDVADVSAGFMPTTAKREALLRLSTLADQVAALRMRVMAVGEDVADAEGCRNVAAWLESRTRTDYAPNSAMLGLATALDRRWHQVAAGVVEGTVNLSQARVIVRALDDLPEKDVPADILTQAEAHLVAEAAHFGPKPLAILGRRILEVVAPELYEDQERKKLDDEEARAARRTSLFIRRHGDGTTKVSLRIPDSAASRLLTYLESFTSPRHGRGADHPLSERVPGYLKLGRAFCTMLEALDPRRLPLHGGDATSVMVTISLEQLRSGLAAAGFGMDGRISAGEARRLACNANLIPAVLGSRSEVLDLGRASRLFSPPQRKAMALRDQRCRAEGCSVPAAWCEAHHFKTPWSDGGRTDLADGKLLCPWHHHRAHDDRYLHRELSNGDVRFSRRR
jgi:hypothetical protein